ncbi:Hypothetical predicted protein [Paramuricea clavata]|uniref:Uncharacterized protein n=1 Tax=Paramuricea clavata TaxID=317549 RepID=A0A7D9K212_PARCT|nr:Hypothetical predicted protein [Paramuricea clavata]
MLLEQGYYDPYCQTDRDLLSFFIPLIQKELNIFKDTICNSHRVRCQKDALMPKGVPLHLCSFPEKYGAEHCGFELRKQAIDEVAQLSGVMDVGDDYLSQLVRQECERVIPELDNVKPQDAATTFIFLKNYRNDAGN